MQRMNAYIKNVVVTIYQPDCLLQFAIHFNLFKPRKPPDAMVNVRYEITRIQSMQFFQRNGFFLLVETFFEGKTVVSFKYLVVGVAGNLILLINKTLMQRKHQRSKLKFVGRGFYFL